MTKNVAKTIGTMKTAITDNGVDDNVNDVDDDDDNDDKNNDDDYIENDDGSGGNEKNS